MPTCYPIIQIKPEWVLQQEALGSKEKFWYREDDEASRWLFKFPEPNTGQHWAEKIAAEVANRMGMRHAQVELAVFQEERGSTTESFVKEGELWHGNQILAGKVFGYSSERRFRHNEHTLERIFQALDGTFAARAGRRRAKQAISDYLVLDAVIGNTDRHHENWAILRRRVRGSWRGMIAPTFDHASSLGRELLDTTRSRILKEEGSDAMWKRVQARFISWVQKRKGRVPFNSLGQPLSFIQNHSGSHSPAWSRSRKSQLMRS